MFDSQKSLLISHPFRLNFPLNVSFACASIFASFSWGRPVSADSAAWGQWRGNHQNGVASVQASAESYPTTWSEESVLWKTKIPGRGSSTPVIDRSRAYVTSGHQGKNTLVAIKLDDGTKLFQNTLGEDRGKKHKKGGGSNPSCATRDGLVYAYFRSGDVGCTDNNGKLVWRTNLQESYGKDTLWWDLGSSPMLTDTSVVIAVMQTGGSYLVALDPKTGQVQWKEDRNVKAPEEAAQSYATPITVKAQQRDLIAVMGADHLTLHDPATGKTLGKLGGFNPDGEKYFRSIASPVAMGDFIVCPYSRGNTLTCVRVSDLLGGKGTDSIVWHRDDIGSDVPTPAASNGMIYVVSDQKQTRERVFGIDIETGQTKWAIRTPKSRFGFSSSPLVAGDHLYVTAENGTTHVIGPLSSDAPQIICSNELDDDEQFTTASPIPFDGGLLIRTKNYLYRIK